MQDKQTNTNSAPAVLLLCTDLMFGVHIQNMIKRAGLRFANVRPGEPLPPAALLVVDLAARADTTSTIREAASLGIPVVAFGPHMDAQGRTAAKEAGATRVLANSNLARGLPLILSTLADGVNEHE